MQVNLEIELIQVGFLREQDYIKDVLTSEGKTDEEIEKYIKGQKLVNSIHHSLANYKDTEINKEKVTDADIVNNNAYVSLDKEGDISWLNRKYNSSCYSIYNNTKQPRFFINR